MRGASASKPADESAIMKKILIIDDDPQLRRYLGALLRRLKYEVLEAEEGEQGMKLLKSDPSDLVITDIVMPGKEGVETIREIRKIHPGVKIIAISGSGTGGDLYLPVAKKLGADVTLAKPFSAEQLIEAVRSLFPGS
jgi:DNA-binding response OmpR family regulator